MAEAESDTNVPIFSSPFASIDNIFSSDLKILIDGGDGDCVLSTSRCCNRKSENCVSENISSPEGEAIMYKRAMKRKLETGEGMREESRRSKYRRSDDDGEKKNARLIKNRESAQLSRQRKKLYVEELEDELKNLHCTITDLNSKVTYFMAENATLRHQVGSGRPRHHFPLVPVAYPWMPCPVYMVKPQGSRVPLLPIPRLKPCSVAKVKKIKKVASVSVLFCLLLFGALASIVTKSSGKGEGRDVSETEDSVPSGSSEPLVASLFVPRNEKLVKIDGNLIIHSVLATEKVMASEMKIDVRMQQWFREGVAGPMFGSGMCTQVFQFGISSTSGVIIPASPATQQSKNTTVSTRKGKTSRRILRGDPPVSDYSLTRDHDNSSKENIGESKPGPSMVVSVLVDPREGSDGDTDGMMGGMKSLSRVFVVALVDNVKYVTYSCNLPQPEVPHLVTS